MGKDYEDRPLDPSPDCKPLQVTPAVLQGFQANYAHYSQRGVNLQHPSWRPLFFFDGKTTEEIHRTADVQQASTNRPLKRRNGNKFSLIDQAAMERARGGMDSTE